MPSVTNTRNTAARKVLKSFELRKRIYLLGSLEKGLTIYRQQVRALNLAWSLLEASPAGSLNRVAIVGGGFAGLTLAAGLLRKGIRHVTLFEKHAALCPLQQGSDVRWVHPHIYEWPDPDSELPSAALPVLNWNAGRASDVVVQVLTEWERLHGEIEARKSGQVIEVYVNVRHLRVNKNREIEWVGQKSLSGEARNVGSKEKFDSIVLAVGFGLEQGAKFPYWSNETLSQPQLGPGRKTFLVSGYGDGALVDLFRIRISRFRQDRVLGELFSDGELVTRLSALKNRLGQGLAPEDLYDEFERIAKDPDSGFRVFLDKLRKRLRTDTEAVLRLNKIRSFKDTFKTRASFQNRFLFFALYKVGGFFPSSRPEKVLRAESSIGEESVVRRHGIRPRPVIKDALDSELYHAVKRKLTTSSRKESQPSDLKWDGGYWNKPSGSLMPGAASQEAKRKWRQEYLPAATELFATGLVTAVAGYLRSAGTCGEDFRVALHRTLVVGEEVTLQQSTDYSGQTKRLGSKGRTFGFAHGVIGYSAITKRIVRTKINAGKLWDAKYRADLQADMADLKLNEDSQEMAGEVRSLMAIPVLREGTGDAVAVLFADSTTADAFTDKIVKDAAEMSKGFASQVHAMQIERVRNFPFATKRPPAPQFRSPHLRVVEQVTTIEAPSTPHAPYLNLEFTDFSTSTRGQSDA